MERGGRILKNVPIVVAEVVAEEVGAEVTMIFFLIQILGSDPAWTPNGEKKEASPAAPVHGSRAGRIQNEGDAR